MLHRVGFDTGHNKWEIVQTNLYRCHPAIARTNLRLWKRMQAKICII